MSKQNVVYPYNGTLFSHKEELMSQYKSYLKKKRNEVLIHATKLILKASC